LDRGFPVGCNDVRQVRLRHRIAGRLQFGRDQDIDIGAAMNALNADATVLDVLRAKPNDLAALQYRRLAGKAPGAILEARQGLRQLRHGRRRIATIEHHEVGGPPTSMPCSGRFINLAANAVIMSRQRAISSARPASE
jgi:hypothetical protein